MHKAKEGEGKESREWNRKKNEAVKTGENTEREEEEGSGETPLSLSVHPLASICPRCGISAFMCLWVCGADVMILAVVTRRMRKFIFGWMWARKRECGNAVDSRSVRDLHCLRRHRLSTDCCVEVIHTISVYLCASVVKVFTSVRYRRAKKKKTSAASLIFINLHFLLQNHAWICAEHRDLAFSDVHTCVCNNVYRDYQSLM